MEAKAQAKTYGCIWNLHLSGDQKHDTLIFSVACFSLAAIKVYPAYKIYFRV